MHLSAVKSIAVEHVTIDTDARFDALTQNLESILGRFDPSFAPTLLSDPRGADEALRLMEGEQGLMIFEIQDHGALLHIVGRPVRAKRYILGNPRIAIQMTRHDIRAGLYAPLSMLVYETQSGTTCVEYDRPSSLFGQFENPDVTEVARTLDVKVEAVIERAEALSRC